MSDASNESFAAIDLGSNSFHMIVANYSEQRLHIIDRIKDMVRLASGLDEFNRLTGEVVERALNSLQVFGQRIRDLPSGNVRAVGTNTLRKARNAEDFLYRAREILGHPIEIISGQEEARLIYLGVANTTYDESRRRLVVDIGGGSTELIIGRGFDALLMESLYMGCANVTARYFDTGEITSKKMRKAILFARQELETVEAIYRRLGWDGVIGSSGTILCINEILRSQGWVQSGITAKALTKLKDALVRAGRYQDLDFSGLPEARKPLFAGGVAILCGVFESLGIEHMEISDGSLREGLIHDLIGRMHDRDVRDHTIAQIMQRYGVDQEQAQRVRYTVAGLLDRVSPAWKLGSGGTDRKMLQWAALVHEIGLSVAHAQHHKHAAYLLGNSDLSGFSRQEQVHLAILVRAHRQKFPQTEIQTIPARDRRRIEYLCILLRLAVLLNRSRSITALPNIDVSAESVSLKLRFPGDWLDRHPLTTADLETEANYLGNAGFKLEYS